MPLLSFQPVEGIRGVVTRITVHLQVRPHLVDVGRLECSFCVAAGDAENRAAAKSRQLYLAQRIHRLIVPFSMLFRDHHV
jgi:hypothetical protein